MKRGWPIAALIAVVATAALAGPALATDAPTPTTSRQVTIVLAPYLSWSDVSASSTPNLWRLAEKGAVGAVNARSRVRETGEPASPVEGALTLSAGSWVKPEWSALAAFNATEPVDGVQKAGDVYQQVYGTSMGGAQIAYLGQPSQGRPSGPPGSAMPGALGQAVRDAGGRTAAIGNSDSGWAGAGVKLSRPAAIVVADQQGLVAYGDVSTDLLAPSSAAPYGVRTDLGAFEMMYERVQARVQGRGPSLLVLDPGDLTRARRLASDVTTQTAKQQWADALSALDAVVGMAASRAGADGTVMVVSQSLYPGDDGQPAGLGPIVVSGSGWRGYVTSASTHRAGVVTTVDVGATALAALGIDAPVGYLGDAMVPVEGPAAPGPRFARLAQLSSDAVAVDAAKPAVPDTFVSIIALAFAVAAVVISQGRRWRASVSGGWARFAQALLLLALSFPLGSWLMFIAVPHPAGSSAAVGALAATTAVVWVAALVAWRRVAQRVPVAALALLLCGVMLADQYVGAPLSRTGFLSYSPLLGARFYGMGNEGAALLLGAAIVGVAMLLDEWPGARFAAVGKHVALPVLGAIVVGTAAAPFLGANIGAAVWAVAGFVLAWTLMDRRTIGVRSILVILALSLALIGVFSAVDLLGGGEQTHLGRALMTAEQGGLSELWSIVTRKAAANVHVLATSNSSWILVAVLGFLAFVRMWAGSGFDELAEKNPNLIAGTLASLVAGAIAFLTEDSGIVVPALIMLYSGAAIAWLMLARVADPGGDR